MTKMSPKEWAEYRAYLAEADDDDDGVEETETDEAPETDEEPETDSPAPIKKTTPPAAKKTAPPAAPRKPVAKAPQKRAAATKAAPGTPVTPETERSATGASDVPRWWRKKTQG